MTLGFGYLIGFRIATDPLQLLAACLLVIVFGFCLSWTSVLIGMLVREPAPRRASASSSCSR